MKYLFISLLFVGFAYGQTSTTQHADAFVLTTGFNGNFNETGQPASNAYANDGAYASTDFSDKRNKEYATNFTFDFSGIPGGSTIDSITVHIDRYVDVDGGVNTWYGSIWADVTVAAALALGWDNSIGAAPYSTTTNPTSDAYFNFTLTTLPTLVQLKAVNFRVRAEINNSINGTDFEAFIDDIYMIVYYTLGAAGSTGKINGVTDPAKINGIAVSGISTVNGQ